MRWQGVTHVCYYYEIMNEIFSSEQKVTHQKIILNNTTYHYQGVMIVLHILQDTCILVEPNE